MTLNVIDLSAYRRALEISPPPVPPEAFIAAYDGPHGGRFVFGTIDANGKRTIYKHSLSWAEARSLISNPSAATDHLCV